jgi:Dyp-type peroxidase family
MSTSRAELIEPVLPLDDIQGIAVPGFFKPRQTLLGVTHPGTEAVVREFQKLLATLSGEITTGRQALDDRRAFRARKASGSKETPEAVMTAVGFTHQGLLKLTPGAQWIPSEAFRKGLAARSTFLGDPTDLSAEGAPPNWKVGAPGKELDALFVLAGDDRTAVDAAAKRLGRRLNRAGVEVVYTENGDIRDDLRGHEHFGFDDGVSQPGIRGRATDASDDFITERSIARSSGPEHSLFGLPGQDLVWPGVLLLGHPASSPDPRIPGPRSPSTPDWTRNGSFLVFRRLRQDVGMFWRTMRDEAARLATAPGFEKLDDEALASRLVGRWPSGAPVVRVPDNDDSALGKDRLANNNFRYDSDSFFVPIASGYVDKHPMAKADPAGITCPWAAHIRKVNTRDSGSDTGGRDSTYIRRLLRVGIPFGKPITDKYAEIRDDPEKGNRGLLFLSIQASIDDQFEFLCTRWMGDPSRPKTPAGHDVLIGQNGQPGEDRVRRCVVFGSGVQEGRIETDAQWVIPTGGGYFFLPSIAALKDVLAAH